jgi:hypothetical protein
MGQLKAMPGLTDVVGKISALGSPGSLFPEVYTF